MGRAVTAAPTYFKPFCSGQKNFIDGSFGKISLSAESYGYVNDECGDRRAVRALCSVGSSKKINVFPTTLRKLIKLMNLNLDFTDDIAHGAMTTQAKENGFEYIRLSAEGGISDIAFDAWQGEHGIKTLDLIQFQTKTYLAHPKVKEQVARAARTLVAVRRARARDLERWERFCHGIQYVCEVNNCQRLGKIFKESRYLRRHLIEAHGMDRADEDKVGSYIDRGKRYPFYEEKLGKQSV